ncbi:MAG TPA: phosphoribosylglycinamide formyltransferase [Candidatus Hydrogenedentes bacterium]|nr:phosphoribosylglycinamide formyltransferase [Candidatus Hydrogenedentota bacterium]
MSLRFVVLLSGGGTTLQNLIDRIERGELPARIEGVISSRAGVFGLERARRHGIPAVTVPRRQYPDDHAFNADLWKEIAVFQPDLVVLAGFMSLLHLPPEYTLRVVNVHPALIPAFCGKGMYGHHVHEAVLAYGAKISGATVHFVDEQYDHGPIIIQRACPVLDDDTPDTLAERVQAVEREIYPVAIRWIAEGRVQVEGRRVRILGGTE